MPLAENLSTGDRQMLTKLRGKAWWVLARTYGAFFLALLYLFIQMSPGMNSRSRKGKMQASDYLHAYMLILVVFGSIFLYFCIKDYRRLILPFQKDLRQGQRLCLPFLARKYDDPVYGKKVLFYPDKEDWYIELSQDDFDTIWNGQELKLYTAAVSGEVLQLSSTETVFLSASSFTFKDMPTPRLFKNYDTYD